MRFAYFTSEKDLGGRWATLLLLSILFLGSPRDRVIAAQATEMLWQNDSPTNALASHFPATEFQSGPIKDGEVNPSAPYICTAPPDGSGYSCPFFPAGWVGGAELTLLKPFHSMGIQGVQGTDFSFDLEPSPRLWLGYSAPSGLGIRARYWEFDHAISGPSIVAGRTETVAFDTYAIDLEFTGWAGASPQWNILLGGGVRYVEYTEHSHSTINLTGALGLLHEFQFSGFGPTVSAYVYRPMRWNFGPFANLRGSVLMGDEVEISTSISNDTELDNIRSIWELQLGAQWRPNLRWWGNWLIRAAYEVQYWNHFSGEEFYDGGESVGFGGVVLAAEVMR